MDISIYRDTFREIWGEDGALCAKIYLNDLIRGGEITEEQVQKWKEYKPAGICYQDYEGHWRMRKIPKLMISLGIWKTGGNKVNNTERTDEVEQ